MHNQDPDFYPCPCCGHLVFRREPGGHEVCPICLWEDELAQLRFPLMPSISNGVSLSAAQQNYLRYGVAQHKNRGLSRRPVEGERVDPDWRPLDPEMDNIEQPRRGEDYALSYPWRDRTVLYYWRPTYWRRLQ